MKIKYEFANETVEIEVDENWGEILVDLDREERNNNQTEQRRHCSIDAYGENHTELASGGSLCDKMIQSADLQYFHEGINQLKPSHRELIYALFFEGVSNEDYAKKCGVTPGAISQRKATALKKLKKIFLKNLNF